MDIFDENLLSMFEKIKIRENNNSFQGTDLWFSERAGKITGSRFNDILPGKRGGYLKSRQDLMDQMIVEELTGSPIESFGNRATGWGHDCEPSAISAYEEKYHDVEQTGFIEHCNDKLSSRVGCSPDGLICDTFGIIEIKCPFNSINHLNSALAMPEKHMAQVQGNMWVTDTHWCDFISFDPRMPEPYKMIVHKILKDEKYWYTLEGEVYKFLEEFEAKLKSIKELFNDK